MPDFVKAREHLAALEALEKDNLTGEINMGVRALREMVSDIIETEERRASLGLKTFAITFEYHRIMYQEVEIDAPDAASAIAAAEPDDDDWREYDDCGETYVGKVQEFENGEYRDRPIPPQDREEYLRIARKDIPAHEVAVEALEALRRFVNIRGFVTSDFEKVESLVNRADALAKEIGQ